MKYFILLLPVICFSDWANAQLYEGYSLDANKAYHCLMRINSDSSATYIYNVKGNITYAEHEGKISRLTDSTYRFHGVMTMGQFLMKSFHKDTIYIEMNTAASNRLTKVEIEYANKKDRKTIERMSPNANKEKLIRVPVDKTLFNAQKGKDHIHVTVNWKNQITRRWLDIGIPYGSAAFYTLGDTTEFTFSVQGNKIRSLGSRPTETGHFKLMKQ